MDPVRGSSGILGGLTAHLGWSLGVSARLAAQGVRFVASLGEEDPRRVLGGVLRRPWDVSWGPISFGCTKWAFCRVPWRVPPRHIRGEIYAFVRMLRMLIMLKMHL